MNMKKYLPTNKQKHNHLDFNKRESMLESYLNFMYRSLAKEKGLYYHEDFANSELSYNTPLFEEIYYEALNEFALLCSENNWYLHEAITSWRDFYGKELKHWDLWEESWQYLCKNSQDSYHENGDGIFCFSADLLFWYEDNTYNNTNPHRPKKYEDGFYCVDCHDWILETETLNRDRSLQEEIQFAKKHGVSYKTLPEPVLFK